MTIAGEQYDDNAYDSDNPSRITAEASDLEDNSTNSGDRTISQTIVGRSHEPNHPELGTDNPLKHNDAAATNMTNSTSNGNSSQPVRNLRKPDAHKVEKPLLAETRTRRGRVRKITWKMKEILRNASYDADADPDEDDTEGPGTVPQFRTLLALALMARRSQAMKYFTGPEKEGWLAAVLLGIGSIAGTVTETVDTFASFTCRQLPE